MRIGPTAAAQQGQAPSRWGKAKPWPLRGMETGQGITALMAAPTRPIKAPRPSSRKRSPGSISA